MGNPYLPDEQVLHCSDVSVVESSILELQVPNKNQIKIDTFLIALKFR